MSYGRELQISMAFGFGVINFVKYVDDLDFSCTICCALVVAVSINNIKMTIEIFLTFHASAFIHDDHF